LFERAKGDVGWPVPGETMRSLCAGLNLHGRPRREPRVEAGSRDPLDIGRDVVAALEVQGAASSISGTNRIRPALDRQSAIIVLRLSGWKG
jgi:hypothetical protein